MNLLRRIEILMTANNAGMGPTPAMLTAWDSYAAHCQIMFERLRDPTATTAATQSLPVLEAWQDLAKMWGMGPGFAAAAPLTSEQVSASLIPALGYTREYQIVVQRMIDLGMQFQRRYAEFMQQGAEITQTAWQAVQNRTTSDMNLASSPAALYECWIDSAETAYAQAAHSEKFARALAELCNLLSSFKVERGKLVEAFARHLDLPSRAEVDSLHRQVRQLTVDLRNAKSRAKPPPRKPRKRRKAASP